MLFGPKKALPFDGALCTGIGHLCSLNLGLFKREGTRFTISESVEFLGGPIFLRNALLCFFDSKLDASALRIGLALGQGEFVVAFIDLRDKIAPFEMPTWL